MNKIEIEEPAGKEIDKILKRVLRLDA